VGLRRFARTLEEAIIVNANLDLLAHRLIYRAKVIVVIIHFNAIIYIHIISLKEKYYVKMINRKTVKKEEYYYAVKKLQS